MKATKSEANELLRDMPGLGWVHMLTTDCAACDAEDVPCCVFMYQFYDAFPACRPCWDDAKGSAK